MHIKARIIRDFVVMVAISMAGIQAAHAQWFSHASGPDVFGNVTAVAGITSSSQNGLVVQCNDKDSLLIAYISPATKDVLNTLSNSDIELPAKLFIKVDQGTVKKLDAKLTQWNNSYVGVVASGRNMDIVSVLHAIGSATQHISVGSDVMGNKQSESFGAFGSTSAIDAVIKSCKLSDIKATPDSDKSAPTDNSDGESSKPSPQ